MEVAEEATHKPTPATARWEMWPGAARQSNEIVEPLIWSGWKYRSGSYKVSKDFWRNLIANSKASEDAAGPGVEQHHLPPHARQHRLLDWCLRVTIVISLLVDVICIIVATDQSGDRI